MDKRTLFFVGCLALGMLAVNMFFSNSRDNQAREEIARPETVVEQPAVDPLPNQKFYVLENEYQQVVFTNVGGAVAEINLPYSSGDVNEVGFDRTMEEDYPANDRFPDFTYYKAGESEPTKGDVGGYYPLLRRAIIGNQGEPRTRVPPQFYAFNIVGKYPELAEEIYEVKAFDKSKIVFESRANGRVITKTFRLPENASAAPYVIELEVDVEGDRQFTRGLWITTGIPDVEIMSGRPTNVLKYQQTRNGKMEVEKISSPKAGKLTSVGSVEPDWIVNSNGFFGVLIDPTSEIGSGYRAEFVSGEEVPSRLVVIDEENERFRPSRLAGYNGLLPLNPEGGKMSFRLFAGPFDTKVLKTVDATYGVNYMGSQTFHGYFSFISRPFSKLLFLVINFFHMITKSWTLSIVLLTVVLRAVLYPLASWGIKSMRRMQKIQPQVQAIQAKYKKDPRKSQQEVMALYRKEKVNPFLGCFPMLLQLPFLIGMFDLLKSTYALRGTSFIPGWINNLTAPDVLFSWKMPIFFIGTEFHLLPLLLGGVMYLQQRMSSTLPKDKSLWTDQQRQQKMMSRIMCIVFMVMFYKFPAGLCIYFMSSMLLSVLQTWIINRQLDRADKKKPIKAGKAVRIR